MKKLLIFLGVLAILCWSASGLLALPFDGHYTVVTTVTPTGAGTWTYDYAVTNNDQGSGGYQGLDGFYIQVPIGATVTNIVDPNPYNGSPGYWENNLNTDTNPYATLKSGYQWLYWWGMCPQSVYPIGTTVDPHFSVTVDRPPGISEGVAVTYWHPGYSGYVGNLLSPAPIPSALLLLGSGLLGLAGLRRFRKS